MEAPGCSHCRALEKGHPGLCEAGVGGPAQDSKPRPALGLPGELVSLPTYKGRLSEGGLKPCKLCKPREGEGAGSGEGSLRVWGRGHCDVFPGLATLTDFQGNGLADWALDCWAPLWSIPWWGRSHNYPWTSPCRSAPLPGKKGWNVVWRAKDGGLQGLDGGLELFWFFTFGSRPRRKVCRVLVHPLHYQGTGM